MTSEKDCHSRAGGNPGQDPRLRGGEKDRSNASDIATIDSLIEKIAFNKDGLVPVIAQRHDTGEVLMLAWMNRESFLATMRTKQMTYWSRSRRSLWRKGETSGHVQTLREMRIDCDGDTLLAQVEQTGPACHTGAPNCFFKTLPFSPKSR